jgi:hypothetical protein
LDITDYAWRDREIQVTSWYQGNDPKIKRDFLLQNKIKYIYWIKEEGSPLDLGKLSLSNIFENDSVIIYQVD